MVVQTATTMTRSVVLAKASLVLCSSDKKTVLSLPSENLTGNT